MAVSNILYGSSVIYTNGPPTGVPGASESLSAVDTLTGKFYTWDGSQWSVEGDGIYGGSGTVPTSVTATLTDTLSFIGGNIKLAQDSRKLYFGASDDYSIEWDGADALHTISAGDFVFSGGNVGIGTTGPVSKLQVKGTTDVATLQITNAVGNSFLKFTYNDAGNSYGSIKAQASALVLKAGDANNRIEIQPYNSGIYTAGPGLVVDSTGQVGIGTVSPSASLDVVSGQLLGPDGSVIAGNGPGIAFTSHIDTGISADGGNIAIWESGNIALNLSSVTKEFRIPSDYKFAFSSATNNNAASDTNFYRNSAGVMRTGGSLIIDGSVGIGTTSPDRLLHSEVSDAATTSIVPALRLSHITSATADVGFGTGIEFELRGADATDLVAGGVEVLWTNAGTGVEASDMLFKVSSAGAVAAEQLRLLSTGQLKASAYVASAFTGTAAKWLAVDATGLVIMEDAPSAGANAALSNLASVAINTSIVSDTDLADDLGTQAIRWNNVFAATLSTGDTAADTLKLRGYDVDGAAYVDILTITANNTVTANLHSSVTLGGNAIAFAGGAFHDGFSDFVANEHIDWTQAGAGTIHTDNYIEGGPGTDGTAIHDNVAGEISAVTEKVTPVAADLILIEDSAAANAKKKVQLGNLPGQAKAYGFMYLASAFNNATTTWETIIGTTAGDLDGFTHTGASGRLTYTNATTKQFLIIASLGLEENDAAGVRVLKNGTLITGSTINKLLTERGPASTSIITSIAQNDYIQVQYDARSASATLQTFNCSIIQIN